MANTFFKNEGPFYACEVAHLLRNEHAWMRRMVKKRIDLYQMSESTMNALNGILDELDQRRK